ncbi:hypothetical protein KP509_37G026000 [Ceratopteris richardii]|uniref:glycerol-3-phosphate 1-O-acyltransferase n=1 Tax=Ceratopteris richardii TaxID=49495 RepID=A0A8T2Q7I8_CERRI|nr:hypothetical protein KP509_37G026000 [Ceratopteris richardii]
MATSQAFHFVPLPCRSQNSAVAPLTSPSRHSLHRSSSLKGPYGTIRNISFDRNRDNRSLWMKSNIWLVYGRLNLKVKNVAYVPSASPAKTPGVARSHSDTFLSVSTEAELLSGIRKEVDANRIPSKAGYAMEELYHNYKDAALIGGAPVEKIVEIMATVLDRVLLQFEDPFTFPSYHEAIREPYDYYMFGQNYIRLLLDFRNSYLGNTSYFDKIEAQLKQQGENVVLLSNHQTEADPAVMALLLEASHPYLAQKLIYIAGDRVVTDPFCKPFSMGRNLLCVYSKKHINDEPELVDMKRKANARSLKELAILLRKGGHLVWIAPSGGRDRPDPVTMIWKPAPFETTSVENIRRLIEHSKAPGHLYPLALLCYKLMPPPIQVQKEIGEERLLGFSGTGLSVGAELHFEEITSDCDSIDQAAECFSQAALEQVNAHYDALVQAVSHGKGMNASTDTLVLSQPWSVNSSTSNEKPRVPCHSS